MCLSCAMLAGTLPTASAAEYSAGFEPVVMAAEARATHTVTNQSQLETALKDARNDDVIQLGADIVTRVGTDVPLVIGANITIDGAGHSLSLATAGIVLEADATIQNLKLGQTNMVRNAILANGHTLTLDNVQTATREGRGEFHLFCGSLTGAEGSGYTNKSTGGEGKIILKNNSSGFAAIYAGNYCDNFGSYGDYGGDTPDTWDGRSSVVIDRTMTGKVPDIYACGAWMYRSTGPVSQPVTPDPEDCPITDDFSVSLYGSAVERVHGYDGVATNVIYTGGSNRNDTLRLNLISGLTVEDGYLKPASATFCVDDAPVTVGNGAVLGFNSFMENVGGTGNITIGDFTGGGTITLAQDQLLTIAGTVTGETAVALGELFHDASSVPVVSATPKTVIAASVETADNAFTFKPYSTQSGIVFERDGTAWTVKFSSDVTPVSTVKIEPFYLAEQSSDPDEPGYYEAYIPITSTGEDGEKDDYLLTRIPLEILINGETVRIVEDPNSQYSYQGLVNNILLGLNIYNDNDTGTLGLTQLLGNGDSNQFPPNGDYFIQVTVPAEYTVGGQALKTEGTLRIGNGSTTTTVDVPTAPALTYNGEKQTAFTNRAGYYTVVSGGSGTNAGKYFASLELYDGCVWSDGDTDQKTVSWSIGKATKPEIPADLLRAIAPYEQLNGSITPGMLIGTTKEMQYSPKGGGNWQTCGDGMTVINTPGVYEVRYPFPDDGNWEESPVLELTVSEAVTLDSISVTKAPTRKQYIVGDDESTLDLSGMELTLHWSDGAENTLLVTDAAAQGITANGADFSAEMDVLPITITFRGKTASFYIAVVDWTITGIAVNSTGHKTEYRVGEAIDLAGLTIAVEHDGTSDTVGVTGSMISGFDTTVPGTHSVTITYGGHTTAFEVTVFGNEQPPQEDTWPVTVNGSGAAVTGAGSYAAGDPVTVTVEARAGYTFAGWLAEGVSLDAAAFQEMTLRFEMPENAVSLIARWRRNDPEPTPDPEPDGGSDDEDTFDRKKNNGGSSSSSSRPSGPVDPVLPEVPVVPETPAEWENPYTADVSPREWYYEAVQYVSESGLMSGTGNGTFSPEVKLSRGMLAQILYNQEGRPAAGGSAFTDVPGGEWFTDAVSWAAANSIVSGYSNGAFGPSDDITREQFILILYRYAQMKGYDVSVSGTENLLGYADASQVSDYAREAMAWACEKGLISGTSQGTLSPTGGATRAEAAAILMRFLENVAEN